MSLARKEAGNTTYQERIQVQVSAQLVFELYDQRLGGAYCAKELPSYSGLIAQAAVQRQFTFRGGDRESCELAVLKRPQRQRLRWRMSCELAQGEVLWGAG
ncbi:Hypothetical predicted protein [Podarcis lilfordi]|uniref:Uncharacterized protein n=1 Tax=Podarcis lilfordi TaxID=74358 RepID=A0AA35K6E4_9SAUR|nr:Hypothetical predicted protein [Podarcis lilfordi]